MDRLVEILSGAGAPGLALLMALENVFPPVPSEVVLPLAGYLVFRGELTVVVAMLAATTGSVVGALALYAVGRYGGRPLIYRHRRILRFSEAELDRADAWFDRSANSLVLFGRMVPFVRSVVSVPAGASEMPLGRFTLLTAFGSGVWNAVLIGAGWALGDRYQQVSDTVGRFSGPITVVVAAAAVAWFVRLVWVRRHRRAS